MRRIKRGLMLFTIAGCAYKPGSFDYGRYNFQGEGMTIGCVDVTVARGPDEPVGPVIEYQFGNRCERPVMIDLGAIAVIGRDGEGGEAALHRYDPRGEVHPVALDGRRMGREALAYYAGPGLIQVCVELSRLDASDPRRALEPSPQWRCFASSPETIVGSVP